MKKYYMHTINGLPAFFSGGQICYANCHQSARGHNILVKTLEQIKKEQSASTAYRKSHGWDDDLKLSYLLVYTPY
ncbi:hypothetical protein LCGC14_3072930 [marine sediment metagenome]|uniref:Uncharacterized protein n=1 Tax=marine sediment metagenome TaxID=412755 RepID=A0A0F8WG83_9ZZZZ